MSKDKIEVNMNVHDIPIVIEELEKAEKYINDLKKENKQLKKQKDDVVEYIKSNCIVSDEWTELDFCNFVPTGKVNYKALNKEKVKDLLRMLGEIELNPLVDKGDSDE